MLRSTWQEKKESPSRCTTPMEIWFKWWLVRITCAVEKVRAFAAERGVTLVSVDGAASDGCLAFGETLLDGETLAADEEVDPDDVVALPYSSGTTGLPKGVMLTHRSLFTSVAQQVSLLLPPCFLPHYH